jgi:hypothetical protein
MQLPLPIYTSSLWLLAVVLATWRITAFLCYEAGPFDVGSHLRRALVALGLAQLVTCFHCAGVWVSLILTFAVFELHWRTLLIAIAVAGATSVLERLLGGAAFGSTTGES